MVKDGFESFNDKRFFLMIGTTFLCIVTLILLVYASSAWGLCYDTLQYVAWAQGQIILNIR